MFCFYIYYCLFVSVGDEIINFGLKRVKKMNKQCELYYRLTIVMKHLNFLLALNAEHCSMFI